MATIPTPEKLTRVKYAGRDFDTFYDDIVARIESLFIDTFNDFVTSDTGVMLIDIVSYGLDTLSWYQDREATENYLETAQRRKNISRLVKRNGYKMQPAAPAGIDWSISLGQSYSFDVPLPVGFQFQGPNGTIFEVQQETIWTAGDTSAKDVPGSQVETRQSIFVSDGTENQIFPLPGYADGEYLASIAALLVDSAPWTEQDFLTYDPTDQFEVDYNAEPPEIRMGDGLAGNIPGTGLEVKVTHKKTLGKGGNAPRANTVVTPVTPLVVAFETINLVVTHEIAPTGGSDPEAIDKARRNAPLFYASRGVAITQPDYEGQTSSYVDAQYGAVVEGSAYSARGGTQDAQLGILISEIQALVAGYQDPITEAAEAIDTEVAAISTAAGDITTAKDDVTTQKDAVAAAATSIGDANTLNTGYTGDIRGRTTIIADLVDNIQNTSTDSSVLGWSANIKQQSDEIANNAAGIDSQSGVLSTQKSALDNVASALEDDVTAIDTAVSTIETSNTEIGTQSAAIQTVIGANEEEISEKLVEIQEHVNEHWTSDCQANLVTVPILVTDADGFYAAPSRGLRQSLKSYLDGIKEVTQTISVVDGSFNLLEADVTVVVKVAPDYVDSEVLGTVEAEVLELLKGRAEGEDLLLQEIYDLKDEIDGVSYLNATIDGPVEYLDSEGNLITPEGKFVTRGTVTVSLWGS